jgi:hypothetical protein
MMSDIPVPQQDLTNAIDRIALVAAYLAGNKEVHDLLVDHAKTSGTTLGEYLPAMLDDSYQALSKAKNEAAD